MRIKGGEWAMYADLSSLKMKHQQLKIRGFWLILCKIRQYISFHCTIIQHTNYPFKWTMVCTSKNTQIRACPGMALWFPSGWLVHWGADVVTQFTKASIDTVSELAPICWEAKSHYRDLALLSFLAHTRLYCLLGKSDSWKEIKTYSFLKKWNFISTAYFI